ncbi:hypothetical protein MUY27_04510 [Mucilaginibacter sp. RS28]|uniref:Uncharacterized protein n=1 Tax=Mucilaginibacter straminoryzae TaxID=2932774 RepID=A0A9X1X0L8_9SPHI|nr:hypothetical protein [Mucilaginibacter straminoryzae]MCJ8208959.1 hypothetical protein [Mucilaginibacter straminoryzae]
MATLKTIAPATWTVDGHAAEARTSLRERFLAFADSQAPNRTLWFFITLMVHGVFLLALPATLVYYFNAPEYVVGITLVCFFANLIANMGGAGIRATLSFFAASVLIHLVMTLIFVL